MIPHALLRTPYYFPQIQLLRLLSLTPYDFTNRTDQQTIPRSLFQSVNPVIPFLLT